MSGVAVVWLVVALVTTAAVAAVVIGLVRHVLVLMRALGRFREEVTPLAEEIAAGNDRATRRAQAVTTAGRIGRSRTRGVR